MAEDAPVLRAIRKAREGHVVVAAPGAVIETEAQFDY